MPDRIIGQGGEADHSVVARAVPWFDVPHVDPGAKTDVLRSRTEVATLIETQVEAFHRVSRRLQERNEDSPYVAAITCDENPHCQ